MAVGALETLGGQVAVAVTGIAGPDGAQPGKPVGTVWFGWAWRDGDEIETRVALETFTGDREAVRRQTVARALQRAPLSRAHLTMRMPADDRAAVLRPVADRRSPRDGSPPQTQCARRSSAARSSARNLHVTVAFLGAVPAERIDLAVMAGRRSRHSVASLRLQLDRVEVVAALESALSDARAQAPPALLTLVDGLRAGLRERGFELRDHETFRPHVTLVRDVARGPAAADVAPVQWPVESFVLVESQVGQRGSEYTVLDEWPLAVTKKLRRDD